MPIPRPGPTFPDDRPRREAPIRAITLDAGGTLLEPWPSVGQVYATVIREQGRGEVDPLEIHRRFILAWQERRDFDYSKAAWSRLVARTLESLIPQAADPGLFEALWHRFTLAAAWHVFDDVLPCLDSLQRAGLRLAVISNWDERLHEVLRQTRLAERFELILPSIEGPAPKPDPRLFLQAARRLDLPPDALLHVGDSRNEDVDGARSAGFGALLLDRSGRSTGPDCLSSLLELPLHLANR